jgi:hypothetical protein
VTALYIGASRQSKELISQVVVSSIYSAARFLSLNSCTEGGPSGILNRQARLASQSPRHLPSTLPVSPAPRNDRPTFISSKLIDALHDLIEPGLTASCCLCQTSRPMAATQAFGTGASSYANHEYPTGFSLRYLGSPCGVCLPGSA